MSTLLQINLNPLFGCKRYDKYLVWWIKRAFQNTTTFEVFSNIQMRWLTYDVREFNPVNLHLENEVVLAAMGIIFG